MDPRTAMAAIDAAHHGAGAAVTWHALPATPARHAPWPERIDARITSALRARGVDAPYVHQAQAIAGALDGRDQVIVTPTASGKTLCYNVPVLQAIAEDPSARALYLFPTKALARDQLRQVRELKLPHIKAAVYDGDTDRKSTRLNSSHT